MKRFAYFLISILFMITVWFLGNFMYPPVSGWLSQHLNAGLYIALFLSAAIPPVLGLKPFTHFFAKGRYPEAIVRSKKFRKINLTINWIWTAIFLTCAILSGTHVSHDPEIHVYLSVVLPIALQILIGIPSIIVIPRISSLKKKKSGFQFESNNEMFQSISLGLNPEKAKGVNLVLQFCLTGKENLDGFLTIKDQKCFYTQGMSNEFDVKIISDSEIWLKISNGQLSGEKALIENLYSIEGDLDALLDFNKLFSQEIPGINLKDRFKRFLQFFKKDKDVYTETQPGDIKKILIIDGSTRSKKFSKSMFMAEKFADGAMSAGAQIETITVRNQKIHGCTGCFACFSKTPGVCCLKDDMSELLEKVRQADLLLFVSPLYVFSISSQLKAFIDRLLPLVQPYMEIHNNVVTHPSRSQEKKYAPMVIFSAGGFPEVKDNFDGVSGMFRAWGKHKSGAGGGLMGEFYLPASEMMAQPVHRERKERIERACFDAGVQVIREGKIDTKFMLEISKQVISQKEFQWQANNYWEMLDGKSYIKMSPGLYQGD